MRAIDRSIAMYKMCETTHVRSEGELVLVSTQGIVSTAGRRLEVLIAPEQAVAGAA